MRPKSQWSRGWKSTSAGKGEKMPSHPQGLPTQRPLGPGVGSGHKGAQAGVRNTTHTWWVRGGHLHSEEATKGGHSRVRSRTSWAMYLLLASRLKLNLLP